MSLLDPKSLLMLIIVLGHAFYIVWYLNEWRTRSVNYDHALLFIAALVWMVVALFLIPNPEAVLLVAAGALLAARFAFEELRINGLPRTSERLLMSIGFVVLVTAMLARYAFGFEAPFLAAAIALALSIPLLRARIRARTIARAEAFMLALMALILVLLMLRPVFSALIPFGFIVLFSMFRWYADAFFAYRSTAGTNAFALFCADVILINAGVAGLFALYMTVPAAAWLVYLFGPVYFYAWAVLHALGALHASRTHALRV